MKPKSAHRYRICGTPVRTGCITCKIRRVKCGEEKPFCKRCTSTGRKCDGYAPPNQPTARKTTPKPPPSTSVNGKEDAMELRMLYLFATVTAPRLSGHFCTEFWQRSVLQASATEPSVRHAVIAIAALHQDFLARHAHRGLNPDQTMKAFAFRHHTKAISHLHNLMSTRTQALDMTLMSCILFISFDCLCGNHDGAVMHLKAGLKILEDIKEQNAQASTAPQSTPGDKWEQEFAPLILSLGVQVASFVTTGHWNDRPALWDMLKVAMMPTQPANFRTSHEARHALESLITTIMSDRTAAEAYAAGSTVNYDEEQNKKHVVAMHSWHDTLDRFLMTFSTGDRTFDRISRAANVLKTQWLLISGVIEYIPPRLDERSEKIITLCEPIVTSNQEGQMPEFAFTADSGVIAALFYTALRNQDISIRSKARELLARAPRREGFWDTDDAVMVADDAIAAALQPSLEAEGYGYMDGGVPDDMRPWNDIAVRTSNRFKGPFQEQERMAACNSQHIPLIRASHSPPTTYTTSPRPYSTSPQRPYSTSPRTYSVPEMAEFQQYSTSRHPSQSPPLAYTTPTSAPEFPVYNQLSQYPEL